MKVIKKVLIIFALLAFTVVLLQNSVMAEHDWTEEMNTIVSTQSDAGGAVNATRTIGQSVITITRVISMGIAIIMLLVLAIKYMVSAPGDRATIKKSAVTYIVGAVVMFSAYGILTIIQAFSSSIK